MTRYYLGIDASKGYADFVLLDAHKKIVVPNFQLDDTFEGHRKLFDWLKDFFAQHPDAEIRAGVESTGGYENNWFACLRGFKDTLPLEVARLNPSLIKANRAAGLKRNQTDPLSALSVAEYLIAHPEKVRYETDAYPRLRRMWTVIRMLTKQKTQLTNQLESLLYSNLPELLVFCREGYPQWLLHVLAAYPTYNALQAAGVAGLMEVPYVSREKAERLVAFAQQGIGQSDAILGQVIAMLATQALNFERLITQQKKLLTQHYVEAKAQVELLRSFKSIGVFSAIGLLLNIVAVGRFEKAKQLVSCFGLHPEYKVSGDGKVYIGMSKKGRSEPRAILFMVTLAAIRHNPFIKALFEKSVARGMSKMAAIGLCMHKILRIVYGILKHQRPFDANIDAANQAKYVAGRTNQKPDKSRRLQKYDEDAPISRRQKNKRKQLQNAETINAAKSADSRR